MLVSRCPKGDSVARGILILLVGVEIGDAEERALVKAKGTFTCRLREGPGKFGEQRKGKVKGCARGEGKESEPLFVLPLSNPGKRIEEKVALLTLGPLSGAGVIQGCRDEDPTRITSRCVPSPCTLTDSRAPALELNQERDEAAIVAESLGPVPVGSYDRGGGHISSRKNKEKIPYHLTKERLPYSRRMWKIGILHHIISGSFEHHTDDSTVWFGSTQILRNTLKGVRGFSPLFLQGEGVVARRLFRMSPCHPGTRAFTSSPTSSGIRTQALRHSSQRY
ncbi:hypothetical protein TNCV_3330341 [Trichonephila clavipes]|nr:hypothetical protein TNCV_3330341 [Trichonephila clavipes]